MHFIKGRLNNMKNKVKTQQVCARIDPEILDKTRKLSKLTGISVSRLIENGLKKEHNSLLYKDLQ